MILLAFFRYDTAKGWESCCWETGTGQEGTTLVDLKPTGGELKRGIAGIGSRPRGKAAERSSCITVPSRPASPTEQDGRSIAAGGRCAGRYDQPTAGAGKQWLGIRENHDRKTGVPPHGAQMTPVPKAGVRRQNKAGTGTGRQEPAPHDQSQ